MKTLYIKYLVNWVIQESHIIDYSSKTFIEDWVRQDSHIRIYETTKVTN